MGMIRIQVAEPGGEWNTLNPFFYALEEWKAWASDLGLRHLPNGSKISQLSPGQWCVKTCDHLTTKPRPPGRQVCFHESDRIKAMMFKLEWV